MQPNTRNPTHAITGDPSCNDVNYSRPTGPPIPLYYTRTLPASISNYITDTGVEWGKIMAAGVLIALPPLIFTFVAAKQIITGLTAGSVKG